jgi:hypothetical protein
MFKLVRDVNERDVRFRGYEVESFSGRRYIYVRYGALTI